MRQPATLILSACLKFTRINVRWLVRGLMSEHVQRSLALMQIGCVLSKCRRLSAYANSGLRDRYSLQC